MIAGEVSVSPARQQRETAVALVDDAAAAPGEPGQDAGQARRGAARKRPRPVKSAGAVSATEAAAEPGGEPAGGKTGRAGRGGSQTRSDRVAPPDAEPRDAEPGDGPDSGRNNAADADDLDLAGSDDIPDLDDIDVSDDEIAGEIAADIDGDVAAVGADVEALADGPVDPPDSPDEAFVYGDDDEDLPAAQVAAAGATADPVKDYLKQIGKVPLLNAEQEVELAKRIEAGLFAEEKL